MQLEKFSPKDVQRLVYSILTEKQIKMFEENRELDFTYDMPGLSRFRVNVHFQRNSVAATIRTIPRQVPTFEELNLPMLRVCIGYGQVHYREIYNIGSDGGVYKYG